MALRGFVLFLCLIVSVCALQAPVDVPLTHEPGRAISSTDISEGLVQVHEFEQKYKRATVSDAPLGTSSTALIASISIGDQPFSVVFDTGSNLLAVPQAACTTCGSTPHTPLASSSVIVFPCSNAACQFCCASNLGFSCPTAQCAFSNDYGYSAATSSGINGTLNLGNVTLGGIKGAVVFGGITQMAPSGMFVSAGGDGIMGFSQTKGALACSPTCVGTVFDYFVSSSLVADTFGLNVASDGTGTLTLGGIKSSLFTGNLVYTPLVGNYFYGVTINSMSVGGTTIANSGFTQPILDTGTTQIVITTDAYNGIVTRLSTTYNNLPGVNGSYNIFGNACLTKSSDVNLFPNIQIVINGVALNLPPSSYFLPVVNASQTIYCFAFTPGPQVILGFTMMRGLYIHFDRMNSRIGFASPTPGVVTSTNATTTSTTSSAPLLSPPIAILLCILLLVNFL